MRVLRVKLKRQNKVRGAKLGLGLGLGSGSGSG